MVLQRVPNFVKTVNRGLVETTRFAGDSKKPPAEVNGEDIGLIAILSPIGVDDPLDNVGMEQRCKRGQVFNRYAEPNRHSGHRREVGPAISKCGWLTRPDAAAATTATRFC